ncbi:MAG: hypothetical protein QF770_09585 [Candidatus Marinimicrobia bacterium]|nr:hypothetical protein [Candidatus Neomarinimicrobiota bacterium]
MSFVFLQEMILSNKLPESADMFHRMPLDRWAEDYKSRNDDMPQWYPHLFGGMPSYGGFIYAPADPFRKIFDFLGFGWGLRYWIHFIIAGIGMYAYLRWKGISEIASFFGSLSLSLSPYLFGLINAGHPAKMYAIAFIPLVLLFAEKVMEKQELRSALLLAVLTAFQLWTKHVQIVYYTWMLVVFFWLWRAGSAFRLKQFDLKKSGLSIGLMAGAIVISGFLVVDPYLPIYQYQGYSTRGAASTLDAEGEAKKGTSWEYATQWSFHPNETISFLYPYFYGLQNFPTRDLNSQAYWGYMPFTQSTHYVGLMVLVLAVVGFLIRKPESEIVSMGVASVIILIIGFGEHFPVLFWPLYKFAPMFGRFRVPSMIYILLPFTLSFLAAATLHHTCIALESRSDQFEIIKKRTVMVFGMVVGLSLLFLVLGSELFSFSKLGEAARYQPAALAQLKGVRVSLFQKGVLLTFVLSGMGLAVLWFAFKGTVKPFFLGLVFVSITVIDLWIVNSEFIHLKSERAINAGYFQTKEVQFLLEDRGLHRILPVEQFNTNWYAYFGLSTVGGYRPVKLRSYQDLLDAKALNSDAIQNMLNVKYVITQRTMNDPRFRLAFQDQLKVYENRNVLPKAWFVTEVNSVESPQKSLASILTPEFNPISTAHVLNYKGEPGLKMEVGTVMVTKYSENEIVLKTEIAGDGFLVLSENYYGPGWRVDVDGVETEIYRTNHVLRGVQIPTGSHTVNFSVDDSAYSIARLISLFSMVLIATVLSVQYRSHIVDLTAWLRIKKQDMKS